MSLSPASHHCLTLILLLQLSSSSTDSSVNSPNNVQGRAGQTFNMQQPTGAGSSTSLPSPRPSSSNTSNTGTASGASVAVSAAGGTNSRPESAGEKTWDLAVDTHIQKSLTKVCCGSWIVYLIKSSILIMINFRQSCIK